MVNQAIKHTTNKTMKRTREGKDKRKSKVHKSKKGDVKKQNAKDAYNAEMILSMRDILADDGIKFVTYNNPAWWNNYNPYTNKIYTGGNASRLAYARMKMPHLVAQFTTKHGAQAMGSNDNKPQPNQGLKEDAREFSICFPFINNEEQGIDGEKYFNYAFTTIYNLTDCHGKAINSILNDNKQPSALRTSYESSEKMLCDVLKFKKEHSTTRAILKNAYKRILVKTTIAHEDTPEIAAWIVLSRLTCAVSETHFGGAHDGVCALINELATLIKKSKAFKKYVKVLKKSEPLDKADQKKLSALTFLIPKTAAIADVYALRFNKIQIKKRLIIAKAWANLIHSPDDPDRDCLPEPDSLQAIVKDTFRLLPIVKAKIANKFIVD